MRVLVIAPHPDDDAIGMGGTILSRIAAGDTVEVLYLTDGGAGIPGKSREDTAAIRQAEARESGRLLGLRDQYFWRIEDGRLGEAQDLITGSLANFMGSLANFIWEYDVVYTTHQGEDHPDHAAAARLLKAALTRLEEEGRNTPTALGFEVWTPIARPSRMVDISDFVAPKEQAIQAHVSQLATQQFGIAALALNRYRGEMHNRPHGRYAEAFSYIKGNDMKIAILFLTFTPNMEHPRHAYAKKALHALLENIAPGCHLHIADDGSPQAHREALRDIAIQHGYEPTMSNSERRGYGGNYNLALQTVHAVADYILPIEDDWQLMRPFDPTPLVNALEAAKGRLECIRLGFLGWTNPIGGQLGQFADQTFLIFDPQSPEHHIFAGHPRLESVAFERRVGVWPERVGAGQAEVEVAGRPAARVGVGWPLDFGINSSQQHVNLFAHIGSESVSHWEDA